MEHLQIFIISVLLAGVIIFFPTINNVNTSKNVIPNKQFTKNSNNIQKAIISPKIIISWLNPSNLDTQFLNLPTNFESFGDPTSLNMKLTNKQIILDVPETIENKDRIVLQTPSYWDIVHSIESKQGKRLYRPRNEEKSCENTNAPCGHFQISAQALKDIGCNTNQCKIDRKNLKQSLSMSKALEKINLGRLANKGYSHLPDFQKYLIHQQGASGIQMILDANAGKATLDKRSIKNMANNSSFSYKSLKNYGSQIAANKFLNYWERKWEAEIELIFANQYKEQLAIREYLQIASNIKF